MEIIELFKLKIKEQKQYAQEEELNKKLYRLLELIDVSDDRFFHNLKTQEEQVLYLEILYDMEN